MVVVLALLGLGGGLLLCALGLCAINCRLHNLCKTEGKKRAFEFMEYFASIIGLGLMMFGIILGMSLMASVANSERDHRIQCESMENTIYSNSSDTCYRDAVDVSPWK